MAAPSRSLVAALAAAGIAPAEGAGAPRVVNVTSESAPGWLPSEEQGTAVETAARAYLAAEDAGDAQKAYSFFTVGNKALVGYAEYAKNIADFDAKAGPVVERRIVKVTWTKDPAQAPAAGVYAALDLVSRFAHVDRHCGYVVLYQPPSGGPFQVMREEVNFLDNPSADSMAREHGSGYVDALWSQLSANCPNYPRPSSSP